MIHLILAMDENRGLGNRGQLAWRLREDMAFFREITSSVHLEECEKKFGINVSDYGSASKSGTNTVIMGRVTWNSIPEKFRPLPGRKNIVITRQKNFVLPSEVEAFSSLEDALQAAKTTSPNSFIIGGSQIYIQALEKKLADRIYLTRLHEKFGCDVFAPEFPEEYKRVRFSPKKKEGELSFQFEVFEKL